ncbi:MAG: hypothetical protein ABWY02_00940 [Telluria sp.]
MNVEHTNPAQDVVEATVILRPSASTDLAGGSARAVKSVLENAHSETGLNAESFTVLEHLNAFTVRAPAQFVEAVGRAPEVDTWMPIDTNESAMIPPVSGRPVTLDEISSVDGRAGTSGVRAGQG